MEGTMVNLQGRTLVIYYLPARKLKFNIGWEGEYEDDYKCDMRNQVKQLFLLYG